MEVPRINLLKKHQKKVDGIIEDLKLLLDAQTHIMVNTGEDVGVCSEIRQAIRELSRASYSLLLAEASAEGQEITGQMQADLEKFTMAQEEPE